MAMVEPSITLDVLGRLVDGLSDRTFSREAWRAHLVAIKALTEALIADVDSDGEQAECQHPEVENTGTFGDPKMQCKACGAYV